MSKLANHDGHGPGPRPPGPADNETARGWARLRLQAAALLMFSGAVAIFALIMDQFFESQRPTRPLVALTLGPALLAAGYLLGRGRFGVLRDRGPKPPALGAERSATPEPAAVPDPPTATDLWAMIIGPPVIGGLALYGPLWGDFWFTLGGIAFLGIWAVAMNSPFLRELAHRGKWVPPGTARHPVLVAIALTALLAAVVVAGLLTLVWVERLSGLAR
jgi:hypothetical protein